MAFGSTTGPCCRRTRSSRRPDSGPDSSRSSAILTCSMMKACLAAADRQSQPDCISSAMRKASVSSAPAPAARRGTYASNWSPHGNPEWPPARGQVSGGPVGEGAVDGGGPAGDLQQVVDVFQVGAHGSLGYAQAAGDLGLGVPGGDQVQQFLLPGCELGGGVAAALGV